MSEHETSAKVSYGSPPVTETSLGIQFSPLPHWDVNLFGLFHEMIRSGYPKFESAQPVLLAPQPAMFLINVPKIRGIYSAENLTDVVQLQDDFFFVNWRKVPTTAVYPRYESVRARFVEQWATFLAFLDQNAIAAPLIHRYQVTYINHTEEGSIRPGDMLSNWIAPSGADPYGLALSANYRVSERNFDVTIAVQPAIRKIDNVRVTQTTITTARSLPIPTVELDPVRQLNDMHDALIETFQSITTDGAKSQWGPE